MILQVVFFHIIPPPTGLSCQIFCHGELLQFFHFNNNVFEHILHTLDIIKNLFQRNQYFIINHKIVLINKSKVLDKIIIFNNLDNPIRIKVCEIFLVR